MVTKRKFGELPSGEDVQIYHLENRLGAYAEVTAYGAILVKLCVPDREGKLTDVVLGYDDLEPYFTNDSYFGAIVGRNANRIEGASFSLYGETIILAKNENNNNLHSGPNAFEKKLWSVAETEQDRNSIRFHRISPDGENGFPGNFEVSVKYELTEENELRITYLGLSDKPTVANMTNHSYFNLNGEGSGDVLEQEVKIHASLYTPIQDSQPVPTGEYEAVAGTPMDFNTYKKIGADIGADFHQLKLAGGYDHNYVTDNYAKGNLRAVANAFSQKSGIAMEVITDCPCLQFYTGNFIGRQTGKNGHIYDKRSAFCLESQVEPNAVNEDCFHSPILEAGERYRSETIYRFYLTD